MQNILIADMKKVLWVLVEDPTSHNMFLSQSLVQIQALTLFISMKAERSDKAAEEKNLKPAGGGLWSLRREAISIT